MALNHFIMPPKHERRHKFKDGPDSNKVVNT